MVIAKKGYAVYYARMVTIRGIRQLCTMQSMRLLIGASPRRDHIAQ